MGNLSSLGSIRYKTINQSISDDNITGNLFFRTIQQILNFNGLSNFKKYYFAYIDQNSIKNYDSKSKTQFFKVDFSGFGFENNWVALQIARL